MQVKLVVRSGSQKGKAVPVPSPKCLIGRSEECHIRPQLEAISRKHCLIETRGQEVLVHDLQSRNGTFVNNEPVKQETVLLNGDVLRVGPVEFDVAIEQTNVKTKRPVVKDIKDAALRTAGAKSAGTATVAPGDDLSDVHRWLEEEDTKEIQKLRSEPETRQFRLDDTSHTGIVAGTADANQETKVVDDKSAADAKAKKDKEEEAKKKEPAKLPMKAAPSTANSREAAADMLKKFFNRR
jgi:pSer/pThr/pTyr-binding forkhead associated (FHA) protein